MLPTSSPNHCSQCGKPLDEHYVINQRGQYFCSEACCDTYHELHADQFKEADDDHPYYFEYSSIRQQFLNWADWKSLLQEKSDAASYPNAYAQWHADDLIDELDNILWHYRDYIQTEGDDGPVAREIYGYTLKLRRIQRQLLIWRPERHLYFGFYCYESETALAKKLLEDVRAAEGVGVILSLNQHSHPFHVHFDYVFATEQERDKMMVLLKPYFERNGLDMTVYDAHLCDGGCGDYLDAADSLYRHDGWLYCESCLDLKDVGEMDAGKLQRLLAYYNCHHEELQKLIYDKYGEYDRYKQWIRRACHVHSVNFPAWSEF
ncbi:hypothetical protein ACF3MZ_18175 [Paenibacillaceae bacterium WGS1546]|uniref:hypothetical protein n=1 Tax=Cohnella sp. WGS1546 TaxID=3366810 RepID=UPI00372D6AFF